MFPNTSWEKSSSWYTESVGLGGHYYHQHIVLPRSLHLLNLKPDSSLLDIACGQGILGRAIPPSVTYLGLDLSPSLIDYARGQDRNPLHSYRTLDVAKPFSLPQKNFSHAAVLLSLQNIEHSDITVNNISAHLLPAGLLLIVLNHPCFRIPRQSAWGIDPGNKLEYRRINLYLSPLKIPITTHPGTKNSVVTWSFHQPLSYYTQILAAAGFAVTSLEEWKSDKQSVGRAARMENRARSEFPLFLALLARKL